MSQSRTTAQALTWNPIRIALELVLPRPCPGCGGPDQWCAGCSSTLDVRPRLVQLPEATLDAAAGMALPPIRAIARYANPVRAAILAGKEHGRTDLPPLLGEAIGTALLRLRRWPPPTDQPAPSVQADAWSRSIGVVVVVCRSSLTMSTPGAPRVTAGAPMLAHLGGGRWLIRSNPNGSRMD